MARRLILDTSILISQERAGADYGIVPDDDVVISSVTLAELLTGIELASEARRARREEFVVGILELVPVEPHDESVARAHARLLAFVHRAGKPRGAHDLIIAATAIATRRALVTSDRSARFDELPDLDCLLV